MISYQIPAYKLHGRPVLFFAAWKEHYSLYPSNARLVAAFKNQLSHVRDLQRDDSISAVRRRAGDVDRTHREISRQAGDGERQAEGRRTQETLTAPERRGEVWRSANISSHSNSENRCGCGLASSQWHCSGSSCSAFLSFFPSKAARRSCRSRRRIGRAPVVDLLQPCAVVGAYRCGGHHGRRRGRHFTSRSRVHCERDDGIHAVRLCRAGPEPRARRVGRGQPRLFDTRRDAPQWPARSSWDAER